MLAGSLESATFDGCSNIWCEADGKCMKGGLGWGMEPTEQSSRVSSETAGTWDKLPSTSRELQGCCPFRKRGGRGRRTG